MDLLKKLFNNESTVVGLCDLKRREAVNSFAFMKNQGFSLPYQTVKEPSFIKLARY